ncbi:MAG: ATP-binding protein [Minicystis sp.]
MRREALISAAVVMMAACYDDSGPLPSATGGKGGGPPMLPVTSCPTGSMVDLYPDPWPPDPYGPKPAATPCVAARHDVIIVLGCPNDADGKPSSCQIQRADIAVSLRDAGFGDRFITTGGAVHNAWVEADTLRDLLIERGVAASDVFTDSKAEHTDENIYYATQIMKAQGFTNALVVSEDPGHLVMTGLCDSNCCVDLGRLTVFAFPLPGGKTVLAGHYALYPWTPEVTKAECDRDRDPQQVHVREPAFPESLRRELPARAVTPTVPITIWITLLAGAGQATIALLASRATGPLALPLVLFGADLALWHLAEAAYAISRQPVWHLVDITASPLTPAFGLHFALTFAGRRRALGRVLVAAYAAFGALSIAAAAGFFRASGKPFPSEAAWTVMFLACLLATVALAAWILLAHRRATVNDDERARTLLLLLALPLAAVFGSTDLIADLGGPVPRLSAIGTLGCAILLAAVTMRRSLFGRDPSTGVALQAAAIGAIAVGGYFIVFRAFATSTAVMLLATAALSFAIVAVSRQAFAEAAARRARMEELARLGRLAAQMAHDLRNPLAALKGAAQFLQEEHKSGRSLDDHADFFDLLVEQADRLDRTIADYQRLGKLTPRAEPTDVGALVRELCALQAFAASGVEVRVSADDALPPCPVDRDLFARALENLARNAIEAMPAGGAIEVRVERADADVIVRVTDTGAGVDARTAERVFDDFFTTKASGSGLGLPFVRRVIEAHGGSVALTSRVGRGTVVELRLSASPIHP